MFRYKPTDMDKKWFLYYKGDRLNLYRSWTGLGMFVGTLNANSAKQHVTAHAYKPNDIDDLKEFVTNALSMPPHFARSNLSKLRYLQEKKQFIK